MGPATEGRWKGEVRERKDGRTGRIGRLASRKWGRGWK